MRISPEAEEGMRELWKASIRPGDRADRYIQHLVKWSPEHVAKAAASRGTKRGTKLHERRVAYAAECTAVNPGDDLIIGLLGEGHSIKIIADLIGKSWSYAAGRLEACHAEGKSFR